MSILCIWFVAYNYGVNKGCFDVINVSINRVSTVFSLTHSAINRLHCHIVSKRMYRLVLLPKRQMTRSLPLPKQHCQQIVNDLMGWCHQMSSWLCGYSNCYSNYRPSFYGKLDVEIILLCPKNVRQQSVNDMWPGIFVNASAVRRRYPIIAVSAAILGINCFNNIATLSSK
jgi:hypothetical protein